LHHIFKLVDYLLGPWPRPALLAGRAPAFDHALAHPHACAPSHSMNRRGPALVRWSSSPLARASRSSQSAYNTHTREAEVSSVRHGWQRYRGL